MFFFFLFSLVLVKSFSICVFVYYYHLWRIKLIIVPTISSIRSAVSTEHLLVTDGRTDGQTSGNSIYCTVYGLHMRRAVKTAGVQHHVPRSSSWYVECMRIMQVYDGGQSNAEAAAAAAAAGACDLYTRHATQRPAVRRCRRCSRTSVDVSTREVWRERCDIVWVIASGYRYRRVRPMADKCACI